ncbi:MAG: alpha/beta hydrolase [Hormoscilla sp. SP5CHS1]|nr:alpha/beta hydrolase [Hormoscilla sp. SP12CHS1]MBC6453434.1 alpha/beta hydrolase [Hormoscilla sp. SP5CHS1]MBC6475523.1 alpha/beta hydrolase [Hormoscilla sp. GM102CHS1]
MRLKILWFRYGLFLVGCGNILLSTLPAEASEQVVMNYQIFQRSVSVSELTTFADTGELSNQLEAYMDTAKQDPDNLRRTLTTPVPVNLIFLDRVLNSQMGELILDRLSLAVHTPSHQGSRQALRSALILSASDDGQITLMETIQKYPTKQVHLEGDRLTGAYNQLTRLARPIQGILNIIDLF